MVELAKHEYITIFRRVPLHGTEEPLHGTEEPLHEAEEPLYGTEKGVQSYPLKKSSLSVFLRTHAVQA